MTQAKISPRALLGAVGVIVAVLAGLTPSHAQYICPDGYYYLEGYGCTPLPYFYGEPTFIYPYSGFGFFYGGRGWGGGHYYNLPPTHPHEQHPNTAAFHGGGAATVKYPPVAKLASAVSGPSHPDLPPEEAAARQRGECFRARWRSGGESASEAQVDLLYLQIGQLKSKMIFLSRRLCK